MNKNKNYTGHSRTYLWHRFEQAEADCYIGKCLSLNGKRISLKLLSMLVETGTLANTLSEKDIVDMNFIISEIESNVPELVEE